MIRGIPLFFFHLTLEILIWYVPPCSISNEFVMILVAGNIDLLNPKIVMLVSMLASIHNLKVCCSFLNNSLMLHCDPHLESYLAFFTWIQEKVEQH